jgi:hypothetical protein
MVTYRTWRSIGRLFSSNLIHAGVWIVWTATKCVPAHTIHTPTTTALVRSVNQQKTRKEADIPVRFSFE